LGGKTNKQIVAVPLSTDRSEDTLVLHAQHHWVSESGDIISLDPATAPTIGGQQIYALDWETP